MHGRHKLSVMISWKDDVYQVIGLSLHKLVYNVVKYKTYKLKNKNYNIHYNEVYICLFYWKNSSINSLIISGNYHIHKDLWIYKYLY